MCFNNLDPKNKFLIYDNKYKIKTRCECKSIFFHDSVEETFIEKISAGLTYFKNIFFIKLF